MRRSAIKMALGKMMNPSQEKYILVVAPYAGHMFHFATQLEIIQSHLDAGDKVMVLTCRFTLRACHLNLNHVFPVCLKCIGYRLAGLKLVSENLESKNIYLLTRQDKQELKNIRKDFNTIEELKRFKIDNFEIGNAIFSSLVSFLKESEFSPVLYRKLIRNKLQSALAVYRSIQNYLDRYKITCAYALNGRDAHMRAVLRACQSKGVDVYIYDLGCDYYHYALFKNVLPQDLDLCDRSMKQAWLNAQDKALEREQIATRFFTERSTAISIDDWWLANKKVNLMPENWDPQKNNIVIFLNSEDEYVGIDETWDMVYYKNQAEGVKKIVDAIKEDFNTNIYIRMHPRLSGVRNSLLKAIESLASQRVTVISADAPIDSYALVKNSSKVIAFGTTLGIEAVFWNKPVILVGPALYQNLGGVYIPRSHDELVNLLHKDLPPKEKSPALIYGFYWKTFGTPFKHYKPTSWFNGTFKGVSIRPNKIFRTLIYFFSLPSRIVKIGSRMLKKGLK
jgi:hypothetical protein